MRFTVRRTRRAYVYPATHFASRSDDPSLPRMGERFRLRRDFDMSGFSPQCRRSCKALKKYGMFVADNGSDWLLSVAPDRRFKGLDALARVKGSDFEVIVPTGPDEGPRRTRWHHGAGFSPADLAACCKSGEGCPRFKSVPPPELGAGGSACGGHPVD